MKTLMLFIALTASVWSSFSYAQSIRVSGFHMMQGASHLQGWVLSPSEVYVPCDQYDSACINAYLADALELTISSGLTYGLIHCPGNRPIPNNYSCGNVPQLRYTIYPTQVADEPTQTCRTIEGNTIEGYHSSADSYCVNTSLTTGGTNPQPLLCRSKDAIEVPTGSGNFTHFISVDSCDAPTGPDGGADPEPCTENCDPEPCTENCEPTDPETPPGGDDGSGVPGTGGGPNSSNTSVTGTATDSEGKVTNINLEMDQDFSPITDRQNETNERLKIENQNSANLIEKVNGIGQGLIEANDNLEGIRDAIDGLGNPDMSGIEGKLDGIKESIDGIKDGMGTAEEGKELGEISDLPDVEKAINDGYDAITDAMHTQANNELTNGLETIGNRLTAFESIPQIFAMASDSCEPISFSDKTLNLCPYAATSSNVLTWALTILTIIFIVTSVVADIKRVRMT